MKQEKPNKSLDDILVLLNEGKQEQSEERIDLATSELKAYIQNKKKEEKEALPYVIFLIVVFVVLFFGGGYGIFHMFEFQDKVALSDKLIDTNESGGISYVVRNEKPVTYQELMRENDSLYHKVSDLQSSLYRMANSAVRTGAISVDYEQWECRSSDSWNKANAVMTDKNGYFTVYSTSDGHLITMEEVVSERDSLQRLANYFKIRFDIAQRKYGIRIADHNGMPDVKSEKLDSALLLYPYYKDRIEKDKDGHWCVICK